MLFLHDSCLPTSLLDSAHRDRLRTPDMSCDCRYTGLRDIREESSREVSVSFLETSALDDLDLEFLLSELVEDGRLISYLIFETTIAIVAMAGYRRKFTPISSDSVGP